jgi:hypothetical protein
LKGIVKSRRRVTVEAMGKAAAAGAVEGVSRRRRP